MSIIRPSDFAGLLLRNMALAMLLAGCSGASKPGGSDNDSKDVQANEEESICQCTADEDCLAPLGGQCAGFARCLNCLCTVETADFLPCKPDNPCALNGVCAGGECLDGGLKACDDANLCTADHCNPAGLCIHTPVTTACNDGNSCTLYDTCQGGTCTGVGVPSLCSCDDDADCAVLDDGNGCTGVVRCLSGKCLVDPLTVPSCPPLPDGSCTMYQCQEPGICVPVPAPNGTQCDDGNSCTTGDQCSAGRCEGAQGSCTCMADEDCAPFDDGNPCNGSLACVDWRCAVPPESIPDCPIPVEGCLMSVCSPETGQCQDAPAPDATPCAAPPCSHGALCQAGSCAQGIPVTCNDGDDCTEDSCDEETGCLFTPIDSCPAPFCGDGECQGSEETCSNCPGDCGGCPFTCGDGKCLGDEHCSSCPEDCGTCPAVCGDEECAAAEGCQTCPTDCGACPPTCGDGDCAAGESCESCSGDCGECQPFCGDGTCEPEEGCLTCYKDCGACAPSCGDGQCTFDESCALCPDDCGLCPSVCGDGLCAGLEDCDSCPTDCGQCAAGCGNGQCDAGETCKSCSKDCGVCPPVCGNAACELNETCQSCPADCGACGPVCGNAKCEAGETCAGCPADCGTCGPVCGNTKCEAGETCQTCASDCGPCAPVCGDSKCEGAETCTGCPADCGACPTVCGDAKCDAGETATNCHADCAPNWMTTGSTSSHGATFNKGPAACQTCHGATLTGGVKSCETCHPGWKTNCTFCHGGKDNQTGAPPLGVDGETLTSQLAVGAHTEHVTASANKAAFACSTCHTVPADALSAGHVDGDGKAETKPSACGLQGTYAAAGTCSSVYCHGNGKSTTTGGTATWTGAALTCQSCHPQAGLTTRHAIHLGMGFTCNLCHGDTVAANGTISNPAKHGNCTRDVKGTFTYAPATKTCSNVGCHGTKTW